VAAIPSRVPAVAMTDRDLWLIIRRALFMVIDACDKRFSVEAPRKTYEEARAR
jgi:hypothetical protein